PSPCRPASSCSCTAPSSCSTGSRAPGPGSRTSPIWAVWSGVIWSYYTGAARTAGGLGLLSARQVSAPDHVHQFSEAVHHVVLHPVRRDFGEEFPGAFDFAFFDFPQLQRRHAALGLGHEIHMLHIAFPEGDGPIRVVIPHGCGDEKTPGQLGIDGHLFA